MKKIQYRPLPKKFYVLMTLVFIVAYYFVSPPSINTVYDLANFVFSKIGMIVVFIKAVELLVSSTYSIWAGRLLSTLRNENFFDFTGTYIGVAFSRERNAKLEILFIEQNLSEIAIKIKVYKVGKEAAFTKETLDSLTSLASIHEATENAETASLKNCSLKFYYKRTEGSMPYLEGYMKLQQENLMDSFLLCGTYFHNKADSTDLNNHGGVGPIRFLRVSTKMLENDDLVLSYVKQNSKKLIELMTPVLDSRRDDKNVHPS